MLLAIDTATRMLSLAVHDGQRVLAEITAQAPNNHTEKLAPLVAQVLADAGINATALTGIAAVVGPGSYTGVRIGVAMAKGIAGARALPAIGVTTLDTVAAAQHHDGRTLVAVVGAGRGRVITGRYRWRAKQWVARGEPRLFKWAELFDTLDGPVTLAGEVDEAGLAAYEVAHEANPDLSVTFVSGANGLRRAGFAAELAWQRLNEDGAAAFPAVELVPIYMKLP